MDRLKILKQPATYNKQPTLSKPLEEKKMKIMRAQRELCSGCEMCLLACSLAKTGTVNPLLARIRVTHTEAGLSNPVMCRHCKNAPCLDACPIPGAMNSEPQTGVILVDEEKCTCCLDCVDACPFGAIWVTPERDILKCDLCGGDPACVKYCPPRPDHSLPHLDFKEQSCLQYRDAHTIGKDRSKIQ